MRRLQVRPGSFLKRQAGQNLVEFAILAPILILLVLGVAETGNALNAYIGVTNAAREGARLAARGNIYAGTQVKQVIESQTQNLNLEANGSIVMTVIKSDTSVFDYVVTQLLGTAASKFTAGSLATLYAQATATANQPYLVREKFVLIEVFYNCPTVTRFFTANIPVYSYTIMKISAPS
jgi:Flp pilus assembly protein TadG